MVSWDELSIINCSSFLWYHICGLLHSQITWKTSSAQVLHLFCCSDPEGSISCSVVAHPLSHITRCRWSQQGWDVPPSSGLQAMSQPASSCSQGCVYCTFLYRGHCLTGNNFCFQQNSSSGSERWIFFNINASPVFIKYLDASKHS